LIGPESKGGKEGADPTKTAIKLGYCDARNLGSGRRTPRFQD